MKKHCTSMPTRQFYFISVIQQNLFIWRVSNVKRRISVLVRANMDGSENLKCLVIGKFQNPRCLENVKSLRVHYYANSPAWMNSEMFKDWVRLLVKKLNKNVEKFFYLVIIVQYILKLKTCNSSLSIDIPRNATSLLHPMDQGIA